MHAPEAPDLRRVLRHWDPPQLWYQLEEIVDERCYLRGGIEVPAGGLVFDVGANVGVAAAFFASVCGAGTVHSFEPVPRIFRQLEENLAAFPACRAHPYGLAESARRATITYYPEAPAMSSLYADPGADRELVRAAMLNRGMSAEDAERELEGRYADRRTVECELRTVSSAIRDLGVETIDLLKIDVERAELDVLRGIEEDDWPRIAQVVTEVHDGGERREAIEALLEARGFALASEQDRSMKGTPVRMLYAVRR